MAKQLTFSAVLNLATDQFRSASRIASQQFSADQKKISDSVEQVQSKLNGAKEAFNIPNFNGYRRLNEDLASVGRSAGASVGPVRVVRQAVDELGKTAGTARSNVSGLGSDLKGLAAGVVGLAALKVAIGSIISATTQLQSTENALSAVTGGVLQANSALANINQTADTLGLRAQDLTKDFTQLAAATRGTQLEGKATEDLFNSVSAAAATLGLGAGQVSRAFTALQQTVSKGVVSQEELRGQLSEAIPGAVQIAARAFGVTTTELNKMVESGLNAEDFVKRFSAQLAKEFPDAAKNAQLLGGQIQIFLNELDRVKQFLGKEFVGPAVLTLLNDLGSALKSARAAAAEFANTPEFDSFKVTIESLYSAFKELAATVADALGGALTNVTGLIESFLSTLSGTSTVVDDTQKSFSVLQTTLQGVSVTLGFLADGVSAIGILFNGIATAAVATAQVVVQGFLFMQQAAGKVNPELEALEAKLTQVRDKFADKAAAGIEAFSSKGVAALDKVQVAAEKLNATKADPELANELKRIENRARAAATEVLDANKALAALDKVKLDGMRGAIGKAVADSVAEINALVKKADSGSLDVAKAFENALKNVSTGTQLSEIAKAYERTTAAGKLSAEAQVSTFRLIEDAARKVAGTVDSALGESLKRLGVQTKAQLKAQLDQVEADVKRVRDFTASGDVTAKDGAAGVEAGRVKAEALKAQLAGLTVANAAAKTSTDELTISQATNANQQAETAAALAVTTAAAVQQSAATGGLAAAFGQYAAELNALSGQAANAFASRLGADFALARPEVLSTADALRQTRQEMQDLDSKGSNSFGSVSAAFTQLYTASLQVKQEFFNQKLAFEGALDSLRNATQSSTTSVADLEVALNAATNDFDLLGRSDLSALDAAVDAARSKIAQLQEQARQTALSLSDMGKTLTQELLRAQGNEVDAIRIEYEKRRAALEKQAAGAGSDPAVQAEVAKNKELLAQLEQLAVAKQQARDTEQQARDAAKSAISTRNPANDPTANRDTVNRTVNSPAAIPTAQGPAQIIEFRAPDGSAVQGSFDPVTGATQIIDVLRKAGANSVNRGPGG